MPPPTHPAATHPAAARRGCHAANQQERQDGDTAERGETAACGTQRKNRVCHDVDSNSPAIGRTRDFPLAQARPSGDFAHASAVPARRPPRALVPDVDLRRFFVPPRRHPRRSAVRVKSDAVLASARRALVPGAVFVADGR
jgi:hypothetical protein